MGCVAHPLYETRFDHAVGSLTPRERWMLTLTTRYNCDTVGIKPIADVAAVVFSEPRVIEGGRRGVVPTPRVGTPFSGSEPGVPLGQTACQLAGVFPRSIRVWKTDDGIREDWLAPALTYYFEGSDPQHLRLVAARRR